MEPLLRVAALGVGDLAVFAARLRLSGAEGETLAAYVRPNALAPGDDDAALRRALCDDGAEVLAARSWLAGGYGAEWAALRARLAALPRPVFPLQGRDLLTIGAVPGPELGAALRATEVWWREGGCVAGREECLVRVQEPGEAGAAGAGLGSST
jgi:poly(A) polymerase/tRNA nucleotidyltransferase (CCA-adding enzyme)